MIDWTARRERARAFLADKPKRGHSWAEQSYAYDREDDMYLGWFDDNGKKAAADKVDEAIAAYVERFKTRPNVVLVNEADRVERADVTVRVEGYIRRNNFWVGAE